MAISLNKTVLYGKAKLVSFAVDRCEIKLMR